MKNFAQPHMKYAYSKQDTEINATNQSAFTCSKPTMETPKTICKMCSKVHNKLYY